VCEDDGVRGPVVVGTAALPLGAPPALPAELRSARRYPDSPGVSRLRDDGHFRLALSRGGRISGVLTGRLRVDWLPTSSLRAVYEPAETAVPLPSAHDVAHAAKEAVRPVLGAAAELIDRTHAAAEASGDVFGRGLSTIRGLARRVVGGKEVEPSGFL